MFSSERQYFKGFFTPQIMVCADDGQYYEYVLIKIS